MLKNNNIKNRNRHTNRNKNKNKINNKINLMNLMVMINKYYHYFMV